MNKMENNNKLQITVDGIPKDFSTGYCLKSILEILKDQYAYPVTGAVVNGHLRDLDFSITEEGKIDFLDIRDRDGRKIYMRSLEFLLIYAVRQIMPGAHTVIHHASNQGVFCQVMGEKELDIEMVQGIKRVMIREIGENISFHREAMSKERAVGLLRKEPGQSMDDNILEYNQKNTAHIVRYRDLVDYFYGFLVPSSGFLTLFDVVFYNGGIVLLGPDHDQPDNISAFKHQPKLFKVYNQAARWGNILQIPTVYYLNKNIESQDYSDLIRVDEARQEKEIAAIADEILKDLEKGRIILISGPSSSGKTSFAQRLRIQLRVLGLNPVSISIDDYFLNKEDTPLDEKGQHDFENITAIDLPLFNDNLNKLLLGERVVIPRFNFETSSREMDPSRTLKISRHQPVILEGLHALNPKLTESIPKGNKFQIYVSPLTPLSLDDHNRISSTDLRLIRRIVRDNRTRNKTAAKVIANLQNLRKGEEKYIYPYQEHADVMFNSALLYELSILKKHAVPLLKEITEKEKEYREAARLLKFLRFFCDIPNEDDIPYTSLLREFIGHSAFFPE